MRGESWWDIVNTAAAPIGGAAGIGRKIQEIVREVSKIVGYVLWDSLNDEYLCIGQRTLERGLTIEVVNDLSWLNTSIVDKPDRVVFTAGEIDHIQCIIGGRSGEELMWRVCAEIKNLGDALRIVPCTVYTDDEIKLDFIHAISFNWEGEN